MIPVRCSSSAPCLALETTLLCHGVPREAALSLHDELEAVARGAGASPTLVGVLEGRAVAGLTRDELAVLVRSGVPKANSSNLAALMAAGASAATTVSATMEIAAAAGIRVFSTGGIGGVHQGYAHHLDVSSDLAALVRFPVAVVAAGVKSILDVAATREALETFGVPVWGFQTDVFPEFYSRGRDHTVDARFETHEALAAAAARTIAATGRGVLIVNPIPESSAIPETQWTNWLTAAGQIATAKGARGRGVTPAVLAALHEVSAGATLRANIELVRSNVALGAALARIMATVTKSDFPIHAG